MLTLNHLARHLRCSQMNRHVKFEEGLETFYGVRHSQAESDIAYINVLGFNMLSQFFDGEFILNKKDRSFKSAQSLFDTLCWKAMKPVDENVKAATDTWIKIIAIFEHAVAQMKHDLISDNMIFNKRVFTIDPVSIEDKVDVFLASATNKTLVMFNPWTAKHPSTRSLNLRSLLALDYLASVGLTPDTLWDYSWDSGKASKDFKFNSIHVTQEVLDFAKLVSQNFMIENKEKYANLALCGTCYYQNKCTFTMLKDKRKLWQQDS